MKKIISTVFYLSLLMLPLTGKAEPAVINEGVDLSVNLNASLNGYAIIKHCPNCAEIRLTIDGTTQVTRHGKIMPLSTIKHLKAHFATVIYDPKTKQVKQIIW